MSRSLDARQKEAASDLAAQLWGRAEVTALHIVVGDGDDVIWEWEVGTTETASVFDLASLTKPMVASLALRLDQVGALSLARRVGTIWPGAPAHLARRSLSSLLHHRSLLPAWVPLYHLCGEPSLAWSEVLRAARTAAVSGVYSDLGYLLWGWSAERVLERPLANLLEDHFLGPLGLRDTGSAPGPRPEVAICRLDTSREVELAAAQGWMIPRLESPARGSVQDGNARFLGGVCGHAGLFGTARDLWRMGAEWLRPGRLLGETQVRRALGGRGPFALGWRRRRRSNSGGRGLSRHAFGHVGFTGGSCWVDPDRDLVVVALAHRRSLSVDLLPWRQALHEIVASG